MSCVAKIGPVRSTSVHNRPSSFDPFDQSIFYPKTAHSVFDYCTVHYQILGSSNLLFLPFRFSRLDLPNHLSQTSSWPTDFECTSAVSNVRLKMYTKMRGLWCWTEPVNLRLKTFAFYMHIIQYRYYNTAYT